MSSLSCPYGRRCRYTSGGTDPLRDSGGHGRTVGGVSRPDDLPDVPQTNTEERTAADTGSRTGRLFLSAVTAFFLVVGLTGLSVADSGRVKLAPGPTYQVRYSGEVPSAEQTDGGWWMTTITVTRLNWAEATWQEITGSRDVVTTTAPVGSSSGAEMISAKQTAALVAESMLYGGGIDQLLVVVDTLPNTPAERLGLRAGDRLVSIDGRNTTRVEDVSDALRDGASEIVYLRGKDVFTASLLGLLEPGGRLGLRLVAVAETAHIDGELIETDEVGGSSGGLMFTMSLLDAFTDGDLTGGLRIAGTGSVRADGLVGAILGARYKFEAVRDAGYDVFFVPEGNAAEVPANTGDVTVVRVDSVSDALRWLCGNGGSSTLCENFR